MTSCHECWQCRERAINDWVGRNIAESKTAVASHAVTLTYANGDHPAAAILTYSDVQKYLRSLRDTGYPVRYFAIGEYGSTKGRAHWHLMLYWRDKVPPHQLRTKIDQEHWPHGFSFWDNPSHAAVRYNCKYIQKDIGKDERQGLVRMSKKPPLGALYFQALAEQHVAQGLSPKSLEYSFPEVTRRKDGTQETIKFMLKDRPAELYLEHYMDHWRAVNGDRPWPKSQLLDDYLDPNGKERRRIEQWFAALPPNLSVSQRLDIDKYRKRLEELERNGAPNPAWLNPDPKEVELRQEAIRKRVAFHHTQREENSEDGQRIEAFWRERLLAQHDKRIEELYKEYVEEQNDDYNPLPYSQPFHEWLQGWADRDFKKRGI